MHQINELIAQFGIPMQQSEFTLDQEAETAIFSNKRNLLQNKIEISLQVPSLDKKSIA